MVIKEILSNPAISANKARIDGLKRQKDLATKALKTQQARDKIASGEKALQKANSTTSTSF